MMTHKAETTRAEAKRLPHTLNPDRPSPVMRRLVPMEAERLRRHLLRMPPGDRRLQYGRAVGDDFIDAYAARFDWLRGVAVGVFDEGELVASGLLTPVDADLPPALAHGKAAGLGSLLRSVMPAGTASLSIAVEPAYQGCGLGRSLTRRLLLAAQNRFIAKVYVLCTAENTAMRHLAETLGGQTDVFREETESLFSLPWPSAASFGAEAAYDAEGWAKAALQASPAPEWGVLLDLAPPEGYGAPYGSGLGSSGFGDMVKMTWGPFFAPFAQRAP